jgi:putative transposase
MPWGLTRFHHSGQSHFVTFCCYHRNRLFTSDASRRIFESALERVRRNYKLYVYGYVIMPEHVHLLLSEPQTAPLKPKSALNGPPILLGEPQQDTLADALKSLKQGVSRRLIGDAEHFWQNHPNSGRFGGYPFDHAAQAGNRMYTWTPFFESKEFRDESVFWPWFSALRYR